jgi:hypothetical protein
MAAGLILPARPAFGQDTVRVAPGVIQIQDTVPRDTTIRFRRAPVSPLGAFFRSLLLPGWGQAKLGRRLTAGLFIGFEGVALGMAMKAEREFQYLQRTGGTEEQLTDKDQEREDWLVLLAFNHLFAGLEAFVGAHLWDFPEDVRIRGAPDGPGVRVQIPVRIP